MLKTNLKPEHFRLAKFDKNEDDVVSSFVADAMMLNLIYYIDINNLIHRFLFYGPL